MVLQLIRINPVEDIGLQKTTCLVKMRDWHCSPTSPQRALTVPPALVCNPFSQALSNCYGLCNFSLPCFAASRISQFCTPLASGSAPREGPRAAETSELPSCRLSAHQDVLPKLGTLRQRLPGVEGVPQGDLGCEPEDPPENQAPALWGPSSACYARPWKGHIQFLISLAAESRGWRP